tara:strand:- start:49 stop:2439 length:2391 start_codon:yes stop_codon:yes gene_type:complete
MNFANVANTISSPPSSTALRPPPTRTDLPSFTDDVKTPDDESTPNVDEGQGQQTDVVSFPDMRTANQALGFEGPVAGKTHDYKTLGFPQQEQPLPDITQNIPTPAEKPQGDMRTGNVQETDTERTGDNYTGTTQEEFDAYLDRKGDEQNYLQQIRDSGLDRKTQQQLVENLKDMNYAEATTTIDSGLPKEQKQMSVEEAKEKLYVDDETFAESAIPKEEVKQTDDDKAHKVAFDRAMELMGGGDPKPKPKPQPPTPPQVKEAVNAIPKAEDRVFREEPKSTTDDADVKAKKREEMKKRTASGSKKGKPKDQENPVVTAVTERDKKQKEQINKPTKIDKPPPASKKGREAIKERSDNLKTPKSNEGDSVSNKELMDNLKKPRRAEWVKANAHRLQNQINTLPPELAKIVQQHGSKKGESKKEEPKKEEPKKEEPKKPKKKAPKKEKPKRQSDDEAAAAMGKKKETETVEADSETGDKKEDETLLRRSYLPLEDLRMMYNLGLDDVGVRTTGGGNIDAAGAVNPTHVMAMTVENPENLGVGNFEMMHGLPLRPLFHRRKINTNMRPKEAPRPDMYSRATKKDKVRMLIEDGIFVDDIKVTEDNLPEYQHIFDSMMSNRGGKRNRGTTPNLTSPYYDPEIERFVSHVEFDDRDKFPSFELPAPRGKYSFDPVDVPNMPGISTAAKSIIPAADQNIGEFTPKEFMSEMKRLGSAKSGPEYSQIGDTLYDNYYLRPMKNLVSMPSMNKDSLISVNAGKNAPLYIRGDAHERVSLPPNKFNIMLAPRVVSDFDMENAIRLFE